MNIIVKIGIAFCNAIYFLHKRFPVRHRVAMISRQSNTPSLDMMRLREELLRQDPNVEVVIRNRMVPRSTAGRLRYVLYMIGTEMHTIATSEVVVLEGYCISISILRHRKGLKVVQMWHALGALKKFGYLAVDTPEGHSRRVAEALHMHENYDYVLCSSEFCRPFYAEAFGYPEEQVLVMPLPRTDALQDPEFMQRHRTRILREYPELDVKVNSEPGTELNTDSEYTEWGDEWTPIGTAPEGDARKTEENAADTADTRERKSAKNRMPLQDCSKTENASNQATGYRSIDDSNEQMMYRDLREVRFPDNPSDNLRYHRKRNILYAPTFRKGEDIASHLRSLCEAVDYDRCNLIVKLHPLDRTEVPLAEYEGVYTCPEYTSMELFSVTDILISDYSSIIFEAAVARIPVYLYTYDLDAYLQKRGFCIDFMNDIPLPKYESAGELIGTIEQGGGNGQTHNIDANISENYSNLNNSNANSNADHRNLWNAGQSSTVWQDRDQETFLRRFVAEGTGNTERIAEFILRQAGEWNQ